MKAFHLRMKVSNPEHFPDVREPDWEFEQDYLDAVESLKTQPREVRTMDGKALLRLLKEQPNEENKTHAFANRVQGLLESP